ncbi:MAG: leucine-rich repeat domain-containing protein [Muribaculaceae bacterium]|nr:leucine-rich repeat domain-containing protein [Muribaculaceae bacterium]
MKFSAITTIVLGMFTSSAMALDVNISEAGSLSTQGVSQSETSLNITGDINAADLFYIGNKLTSLKSLNLSKAKIVEYQGAKLEGSEEYPAATLPKSVFAGSAISNIVLPEGKVTISDAAFMGTSIETIDLSNVDSIGQGAFASCKALKEVVVPNVGIGTHLFDDCTALTKANMSGRNNIPDYTFSGCVSLTTIEGVENVITIGQYAMSGCKLLYNYTFSHSLKHIGASAFEMSGITEADLTDTSLKRIEKRAFAGCINLETASLPDDIAFGRDDCVGEGVYFGDTSLKNITLPIGLTNIPARLFKGTGIEGNLVIKDCIASIGDYALKDVSKVTSIKLPYTLQYIGNGAMEKMTGLEKINVLDLVSVPNLGQGVWKDVNKSAVELEIKEEVKDDYSNADQWKEFKFKVLSVVDDIKEDTTDEAPLKARFEGTDMYVYISGTEIELINVYDTAGQLLVSVNPGSNLIVIDTADMNTRLYIINAKLKDGRVATVKIARK